MSEISSEQRPAPEAPLWAESQRRICILGSTGSIGTQALDVVRTAAASAEQQAPFRVVALAAGSSNLELLAEQAVETRAPLVATSGDVQDAELLERMIASRVLALGEDYSPQILAGSKAAVQAARAPEADLVLNGITGSIGLAPTLAALEAGKLLALANKESLIIGGPIVKDTAATDQIVPVDSEHSAIAQALRSGHSPGRACRAATTRP